MYNWKQWFLQLGVAFDQFVNVVITPGSEGAWADETLSSRAYRMHKKGKLWGRFWMPVIDWLFRPFGKEHCKHSYLAEGKRLQSPPEARDNVK